MNYIIALIAGAGIFLGLSPYNLWYIAALSVLIFAVLWRQNLSVKQSFILAISFYLGMFGTGIHWLYVSIHTHGQVPALLAIIFTAGFACLMALISSLPWLLSPVFKNGGRMLAFPALWLLSEWGRGWILTGFPWLYVGQSHLDTPLAGWMPVSGVLGAGMAVAISAIAIIYIFTERTLLAVIAQSAVLIFIWAGGGSLNKIEWTEVTGDEISATLIQPNIQLAEKWNPAKAQEILDILHAETEQHWENNLLIWPEAALPYVGEDARSYLAVIEERANRENTAFISGYLTYDIEARRFHNAIGGVGLAKGEYLKQRLVPFGEYVPFEDQLRGIMHFFNFPMSVISPGSNQQSPLSFDLNGQSYIAAPAICYEIAYAPLVAKLAKDANLIVTLSNDAWFGDSIGPWQHAQIAQVRALENRKPVVRVTNTGITISIGHRGDVLDSIPQFQPGSLSTKITARSGSTPFSRYGNWPALAIAMLLLAASVMLGKIRS